jgi:thiosulfate dehydrogenase
MGCGLPGGSHGPQAKIPGFRRQRPLPTLEIPRMLPISTLIWDRQMKLSVCLIATLTVAAATTAMMREGPAADVPQLDLAEWTPPSIGSAGDDPFGKLVKYGYALFTDTPNQIGPAAADPAKRFSRSSLTCQNCHLKAGTQPYAVPLMGVWGQFPQYRGREGEIGTLEERINGCLERSMNGHVMPLDGTEMKAYLAYMKWLSTGIPDGAKLVGAGIKSPAVRPISVTVRKCSPTPARPAMARTD